MIRAGRSRPGAFRGDTKTLRFCPLWLPANPWPTLNRGRICSRRARPPPREVRGVAQAGVDLPAGFFFGDMQEEASNARLGDDLPPEGLARSVGSAVFDHSVRSGPHARQDCPTLFLRTHRAEAACGNISNLLNLQISDCNSAMRRRRGYPRFANLARIAPGKGPGTSWVGTTNPVPGSGPWGGDTRWPRRSPLAWRPPPPFVPNRASLELAS